MVHGTWGEGVAHTLLARLTRQIWSSGFGVSSKTFRLL